MMNNDRWNKLGIAIPEILVPSEQMSAEAWAVIACDQFSSEPSYWAKTKKIVGDAPSTLNMIIPECFLDDPDRDERLEAATRCMSDTQKILRSLAPGMMLVQRSTPHASSRQGLVLAIDLEAYDFSVDSSSLIRPTEGTIRERLPARMNMRRKAKLDLPHILLLMDDPEDRVMQAASAAPSVPVYDFELMQGGGHISGRFIKEADLTPLFSAFEALAKSSPLFAVGDGNHSLAAAREIWLENKAAGASLSHPTRYALVELENIHDPGMHFHPIHRVLFGVNPSRLIDNMSQSIGGTEKINMLKYISASAENRFPVAVQQGRMTVETLQDYLDTYLQNHPETSIDYIHGEDAVREIVLEHPDRLGLILPDIDKSRFFDRIRNLGPYPRKTFSIGEAVEKRYYLEARSLV